MRTDESCWIPDYAGDGQTSISRLCLSARSLDEAVPGLRGSAYTGQAQIRYVPQLDQSEKSY